MSKKLLSAALVGLAIAMPIMAQHAFAAEADACKNCVYASSENSHTLLSGTSGTVRMVLTLLAIAVVTTLTWFTYRKKSYIAIGSAIFLLVGGSFAYSLISTDKLHDHPEGPDANCSISVTAPTGNPDEFKPVGSEFESSATADTSSTMATAADSLSEFKPISDEFSAQPAEETVPAVTTNANQGLLYQTLVLLALAAIIGLTLKYQAVRRLRGLVMLASVVYLGFYTGGCPCMIMSLQDTLLFALGGSASMVAMLWFLGLIPVTYFFGKTWCGWLCHLGGLQDFLFKVSGKKILTSPAAQKRLKQIQIALLALLLVQLAITRTNIWVKYDPFKAAFNLMAGNHVALALLGVLLLSSLFIYRPFCRAACPVGLILGWVTKIPGARKLNLEPSCINCRSCARACNQSALVVDDYKKVSLRSDDCILCGECFGSCKKESLIIKNKPC